MKAMLSTAPGGPETLEWSEIPNPDVAPGQLLVRIHSAGVNYPDTLIIRDLYQMKPPRPFAPGGEISGRVIGIGEDVEGFSLGDRVLALTVHGGFATHICISADQAIKFPSQMTFEEAACFIFTYGTSYHALKDRARIQFGETLLILGAAGGVGAAAIELAKAAGANVIAAVSSEEKAVFCRNIGADETIVYSKELDRTGQKEFTRGIKKLAGNESVDIVYDAVGGNYAEAALRTLAWEGRYLVVGFPAGIPKIPLNLTLLKGCQILGVFWGASVLRDPKSHLQNLSELFDLYTAGKIKPHIGARFDMKDAKQALEMLQNRNVLGKVVLTNG